MNGRPHTETYAVPAERLEAERPLLGDLPSLRPLVLPSGLPQGRPPGRRALWRGALLGARQAGRPDRRGPGLGTEVRVPHFGEVVATHDLVAPGEASIKDEHYGGPRRPPRRQPRPRTAAEKAICALGEVGEAFIKAAAAAGVTKLGAELEELAALEAAHGADALVAALARAVEFSRYKASDVRSILAAGTGLPQARQGGRGPGAGPAQGPEAPAGRLRHRAGPGLMTTTAPPLPADLEAGLRRLKLATVRRLAPELMLTPRPSAGRPRTSCAPSSRPKWPPGTPPWPPPG